MNVIAIQVENVLAGKTALGAERFSPITFPRDPRARELLIYWANVHHRAAHRPGDAEKTAFVRKLAHYILRNWPVAPGDSVLTRGAAWFIDNPHHVRSKLSVKAAANLFTQQVNDTLDVRKAEFQALRLAMATPEPPCPVLLAHGAYTLIELIHPQHLVRAGLSAGNCLILKRGTDVRANPRYWSEMARGALHIYALSRGKDLYALFSAECGFWRELEILNNRLPDAIAERCLKAIESQLGPLNDLHVELFFSQGATP